MEYRIDLADSDHVDLRTTYQVRIPTDLIKLYIPTVQTGDQVRITLPFSVRRKELLLDPRWRTSSGGVPTLLLKDLAAQIQAGYVAHVDGRGGVAQPLDESLWWGISAFTPAVWRDRYAETPEAGRGVKGTRQQRALAAYLSADLGFPFEVHKIEQWLSRLEPVRSRLLSVLEEPPDLDSASECVLLALPFMEDRPVDLGSIDLLIEEYRDFMLTASDPTVEVVAEYGRRWEALLDIIVPVDSPFLVELTEKRPWMDGPDATFLQDLPWGDALSAHVEIRSRDHAVEIKTATIQDLLGTRGERDVADELRATVDAVAFYASDAARPYMARVSAVVGLRGAQRTLAPVLIALIAAATIAAITLPDGTSLTGALAVITFPLTLAGTVVLTRQATPLADRLLRRRRVLLVLCVVVLWVVSLSRMLLAADVAWAEAVRDAAAWTLLRIGAALWQLLRWIGSAAKWLGRALWWW